MKNNLKKNIFYNFAYQILILVLPLITTPYLSRTLGAKGIGIYSFSQSIATYFIYITVLGLSNYGNRAIAAVQNDKDQRSKVFFEIYTLQLVCFTVSIIVYIIYTIFWADDRYAAIAMSMWVWSSMFDINWFFFGMEQFKLTVIRNIFIKIFSVICIFIFVHNSEDVYIYILIMSCSALLSQLCLWPYIKTLVYFIRPNWNGVLQHLKPNLKLFIPIIASSIYNMMDKIMLGYMTNMEEVGFYENAEKIIKMVQSLIIAIGTVMLPRMSALACDVTDSNGKKYFDYAMEGVIIYVSAAIFGILAIKDTFTYVYFGPGFEKTASLLALLVVTVFFFGIGNVLRTQYLIPQKLDKIFIDSSIMGAVLNIVVNAVLIPYYASVGAAIATIFAEVSVCIYQFYKVRNNICFKRYLPVTIVYLSIGLFMYWILKHIKITQDKTVYLMRMVFIGGVTFILLTFFVLYLRVKLKLKRDSNG